MNMAVKPLALAGLLLYFHTASGQGEDRDARRVQPDLIAAVAENDADRIAALPAASANVKNKHGETAAAIAERKDMTEVLVRLREADETSGPAHDLDPEVLVRLLSRALKRDSPDTVLRLLEGVDVEELGFSPLHEAAGHGSVHMIEALLDAGLDPNGGTTKPLHVAARYESLEAAVLLIERGAKVDAKDDIGWTPLHYALLKGMDRPAFRTAKMLLEHGADANAATAAVGWTPLHLAAHLSGSHVSPDSGEPSDWNVVEYGHGPDVLEIVQILIKRGADVGARTRIGGWSPARVAKASDKRRRYGLEAGASSKAVQAAIQAAGGKDEACDDAPMLPAYVGGRVLSRQDREQRHAIVVPGCAYGLPFAVPGIYTAGGRSATGSFTAPGADEALQFAGVGIMEDASFLKLASLQDQQGVVRPIMTFDHYTDYEGLCLDRETNTHTAVFTRSYDGTCCPWEDTVYYHYDADAGNLVEVHVDDVATQPTGGNAVCHWRNRMVELADYQDALSALRVGESPSWPWDAHTDPLWEGSLPTRTVSAEVVESQLERLRGLPGVVRVWNADLDSPGRKIVVAKYIGIPRFNSVDVCEGVLLAWDEARQEWRSIYDCAGFFDIEIRGDTLSAALYVGTAGCGIRRLGRSCYLEVDLTTWQAELWDEPHGNYWSNRRTRPER